MCVCLFCFVLLLFCVVGRQQHCRYIVTDAMVYPRNWILEDVRSLWTESGIPTSGFRDREDLNLEVTTLCMSRTR